MFKTQECEQKCRAFIDGEMTIYTANDLKEKLDTVLDDSRELEIDLSKVNDIDSAGVQLLILAKKTRSQKQLALSLVKHSHVVLEIFETMGLVPYFADPVILQQTKGE